MGTDPIIFLIDTFASLYILTLLLRFLLQWVRADFRNPISQFLVKITHPPLKILRRFIPSMGKIDTSSIVLALSLQMFADFLILLLEGATVSIPALVLVSMTQLISMSLDIFVFAVFARALLSWFDSGNYNPASSLLQKLTEPLLEVCRKIIPAIGGMDLSPLFVIIFLQLAKMTIIPRLNELSSLIS